MDPWACLVPKAQKASTVWLSELDPPKVRMFPEGSTASKYRELAGATMKTRVDEG